MNSMGKMQRVSSSAKFMSRTFPSSSCMCIPKIITCPMSATLQPTPSYFLFSTDSKSYNNTKHNVIQQFSNSSIVNHNSISSSSLLSSSSTLFTKKRLYNFQNDIAFQQLKVYYYSTTKPKTSNEANDQDSSSLSEPESLIIYEGPFASLAKRLKRISITSAIVSIIGIPLLITFHSGDVPISGQAAVGTTAIIAATGSTAALSFCFGPYVNQLKYIVDDNDEKSSKKLIQATTTNIFGMEKVTIFDPDNDVSPAPSNNKRPFCNFMIKDEPYYIHPELLNDDKVRVQLLGEDPLIVENEKDGDKKSKKDLDDDTFL